MAGGVPKLATALTSGSDEDVCLAKALDGPGLVTRVATLASNAAELRKMGVTRADDLEWAQNTLRSILLGPPVK